MNEYTDMPLMKAFVITIVGLPLSEQGSKLCVESARPYGLNVEIFPATTRYEAETASQVERLKINRRVYDRITDEPIQDRDKVPRGRWNLTTPELGCFMSHFRLWKLCASIDEPVVILEHDVRLVAVPPRLAPTNLVLNLCDTPYALTCGYVIAPGGARLVIEEAKTNGVQPSDEILWRTVLRPDQIAISRPPVIYIDDRGFSTIQYTRTDRIHEHIHKKDPWSDYHDPGGSKD